MIPLKDLELAVLAISCTGAIPWTPFLSFYGLRALHMVQLSLIAVTGECLRCRLHSFPPNVEELEYLFCCFLSIFLFVEVLALASYYGLEFFEEARDR
jgi:hypothetical protein